MLETAKRYLRYTSWPIIAAMLTVMVFGILAIRVCERADPQLAGQTAKQLRYAIVALVAFVVATMIPYPRIGRAAYALFALTLVLLVVVLFSRPINYSHRWIKLGPIGMQPSEIAKLTYIIMLGWYLRYGDHYRRMRGLIVPFVLAFVPMGLILYEPDLGTALLFLPTLYFMLFMAGAKLRHLLLIVAMGVAAVFVPVPRAVDAETLEAQADRFEVARIGALKFHRVRDREELSRPPKVPVAYCRIQFGEGGVYDLQPLFLRVMRGTQQGRIEGWVRQNDDRVAMNEGFQLRWSLITLSTGRWMGRSGRSADDDPGGEMFPLAMDQLPFKHTDFIFSVIGGRWGFLGCLVVLGMYAVILVFGIEIATITYDPFGRLLAVGVLGLLLSQIFINVGMAMGLMPITGMTLPLVSCGGTSIVVNCAALGLLVNVGQRRPILLAPHPFEYGERREKQVNLESTAPLTAKRRNEKPRPPGGAKGDEQTKR